MVRDRKSSGTGDDDLVLTTTLEPCLQCAAAIRLSPVATVRFAGADRYWAGCHDFAKLSEREAERTQPARVGPRQDELGLFATVISRLGPALSPAYRVWLLQAGEGRIVDLAERLAADGRSERLAGRDVASAFIDLWPELRNLRRELEVNLR